MTKNNIDNKKVFNYLKNVVVPNKESLNDKDLVLAILSLAHVENVNNLSLGLNATVMSGSALAGLMIGASVTGLLGLLVTGTIGTVGAVCSDLKRKQIKNIENELTDCLMKRYDNFKVAYEEIAKLITSTTREEILSYLELASR